MLRRSYPDLRSHPIRLFKVSDEIRLDGVEHYPKQNSVKKCAVYKELPKRMYKMSTKYARQNLFSIITRKIAMHKQDLQKYCLSLIKF